MSRRIEKIVSAATEYEAAGHARFIALNIAVNRTLANVRRNRQSVYAMSYVVAATRLGWLSDERIASYKTYYVTQY